MKVVILAGGFGTRLSEYTELIPKPMVTIGNKPVLWHIMKRYAQYGHTDFIIALGYKSEIIKEFFLNYHNLNSDFSINLSSGAIQYHEKSNDDWNVTLVDTGLDSLTGKRVKLLEEFIGDEPFMMTYGDGVADINISKLVEFHESQNKMVTLTAVRPVARFGELDITGDMVNSFIEKPQLGKGWINGGFFVIQPDFLKYIGKENIMLERDPLEKAANNGQLCAFRHNGFWQCMDTKRDHEMLEKMYKDKEAPWIE